MQGMHDFVPTEAKATYINQLLKCDFDTIDFGSFVSPKAIPQMRDTAEVLSLLDESQTKLLAIVANERGAKDASVFDRIDYLGYPFSVSEEFQKRNTNATIEESLSRVESIADIAAKTQKKLVVYLSMGFGNPYGEHYHPDIVSKWSERLNDLFGVNILALSDTIGAATPELVKEVFLSIIPELPEVEFGAHLHTTPEDAKKLTEAAYNGGCRRFDGAVKGYGGCPMAKDDLTGNMPTEQMIEWFDSNLIATGLNNEQFATALRESSKIFA
jgi:hydroxymethylglutaryl-CoA lyase